MSECYRGTSYRRSRPTRAVEPREGEILALSDKIGSSSMQISIPFTKECFDYLQLFYFERVTVAI